MVSLLCEIFFCEDWLFCAESDSARSLFHTSLRAEGAVMTDDNLYGRRVLSHTHPRTDIR